MDASSAPAASFKGKSAMPAEPVRPCDGTNSARGAVLAPNANSARITAMLKIASGSLVLAAAWLVTLPVSLAQSPTTQDVAITKPAAVPAYAKGEVKKIDAERGVITLKHGPIKHMGMPDMTMAFYLAHSSQVAGLKVGDQVQFRIEKIAGTLVVVELIASR